MARWHSCNVLYVGADTRRIWQFDARNGSFGLNREQTSRAGEPLPSKLVGKSWGSLWQRKLNVAWLPPEHVFFRVAHFPASSPDEIRSMVELQLERLSPIPVTQALWTMQILPPAKTQPHRPLDQPADTKDAKKIEMQTVVVTVVERSVVEEFLGRLEGEGYMADRLELPMLDHLQFTDAREDGAWIYPEGQGGRKTALVAWWYGGVLQNLDLLSLPAEADPAANMRDQLLQMAWAGELEGWLTAPPRWHLVAGPEQAAEWEPPLRQGLDQPIDIIAPSSEPELAASTARRATQADPKASLLPPEFATRYRQQFVDRLWIRSLGAMLAVYGAVLVVYFIAVWVLGFQTKRIEKDVARLAPAYTNSMQLTARLKVLKDRQELRFAALNVWGAVAEHMPANVTLDSMSFADGRKVILNGTATDASTVYDFGDKLRKAVEPDNNQPVFKNSGEIPGVTAIATGVRWVYELEARRTDELPPAAVTTRRQPRS